MSGKYIIGLDIGTTKICAVVTRVEAGLAEIAGLGMVRSGGLRKGVVVDMDETTDAIRAAVNEAEATSGIELRAAYVGVTGSHIKCEKSYGATGIKGSEIARSDLDRVMDSASSLYVPLDREVLHVLPTDFVIDGQGGILKPLGMSAARMEVNVRVITASHAAVENLLKCCRRAGVEVVDTVFEPLASTRAVARAEELDAGVAIIDIGGGTSDVAIYKDGGLRHATVLPVGGNHITNDIAIGLRLSQKEAERVKTEHGYAVGGTDTGEKIDVVRMNNERDQVSKHQIKEIIRPRCEEMMRMLKRELHGAATLNGPSCVVLTGGTALLGGLDRLGEAVFGLPVRRGVPENGEGQLYQHVLKDPVYSTGVGLVLYGQESETSAYEGILSGLMQKVKGTTKNLLEVKGWGIRKRAARS